MKTRATAICSALSAVAALSAFGLAAYLRSLGGTVGLLAWMPRYSAVIAGILLVALIPPAFLALAAVFRKRDARAASAVCLALAALTALPVATLSPIAIGWHRSLARAVETDLSGIGEYRADGAKHLVRLAFSSDPHVGNPEADEAARDATLRTVATGGYDAFFALGDLSEMGVPGSGLEDAAALFASTLGEYGTPLITLMGNHDSIVGGEYRYRTIFNDRLYFRIDSGTAHIVALNLLWGAESFDAAQKDWLVETLDSIPESDETIVIAHSFIRSSGYVDETTGKRWYDSEDLIRELAPILESGGVDLVVTGHNHFMEYLEHGNTAYAVVGALGGKSDPERTYVSPDSRWYLADGKGFLDVDLYGDGMRLTFRDQTGKQLFTVRR